ncbi:MAG TPA: EAL domain-containing protein [Acidimicrobiales bacterium]|nr:EAL domain-containing protein [Acidimicrobiales bacterium]
MSGSADASERLRLLESVVGNAKDAVVLTDFDADGEPRIVFVNPAFTEQTGYQPHEVLGRHPRMLVGPDSDRDAQLRLRRAAELREATTVELTHYRADGTSFLVENTVNPVIDDTGRRTHLVSIQRDISERKLAERQLAYQAVHDPLTRLPNRTLFADRLSQALSGAGRHGSYVGLLLMDLDRFKAINDTLGHDFGDQVLVQVALRLATVLRSTDTVARLGGDEFAFVLPDLDSPDEAELVTAKILLALEAPFELGGITIPVDASIGVALAPIHGSEASVLMRRADVAMYRAKEQVTGYAVYSDAPDEGRLNGLGLMVELRRAIEAGELELLYQPVVDLQTMEVVAVEALSRWQHPTRGLLLPTEFIPLAEQTGVIRPLTDWMLTTALNQLQTWHEDGWPVRLSVNISARLVADRELPGRIMAGIERAGVAPSALQIEVTESTVMVNPEWALDVFTQLTARGVLLTLDDFGTGYSSLNYLKRLPVHQIKVDKSFVLDMLDDGKDASIVRAIIDLGHNLGLTVVAEGVEDAATLDALVAQGCDFGQGYLLGRPVTPSALTSVGAHGHHLRPALRAVLRGL